jgi:uncharacterized membrane protein YraQ (UPF0718 family)
MSDMTALSPAPTKSDAIATAGSAGIIGRLRDSALRLDYVLIGLALLFGGLSAYSANQALVSVRYVARELAEIAPWLIASVCIAAAAQASGADRLAARAFQGRQPRMILVASLIGALLPFCSCGVIPLVTSLLGAGVPLAPVMAFWISSPLMDPTQFFIAWGVLGVDFATAKLLSAVGMGLLSGFGTMLLIRMGWLDAPAMIRSASITAKPSCCGSGSDAVAAAPVSTSCCGKFAPVILWRFWSDAARAQRFLTTATRTGWFLLRWLAVAYTLESLMLAWLPTGAVGAWLGTGAGPFAIPLAVGIGLPVYLNSFAAIPFVSGLVKLGMSPATGLAFMLATSATGFPAMVAVWVLVKPRAFGLYLCFAITGALIAGYAYATALAFGI